MSQHYQYIDCSCPTGQKATLAMTSSTDSGLKLKVHYLPTANLRATAPVRFRQQLFFSNRLSIPMSQDQIFSTRCCPKEFKIKTQMQYSPPLQTDLLVLVQNRTERRVYCHLHRHNTVQAHWNYFWVTQSQLQY